MNESNNNNNNYYYYYSSSCCCCYCCCYCYCYCFEYCSYFFICTQGVRSEMRTSQNTPVPTHAFQPGPPKSSAACVPAHKLKGEDIATSARIG